MIEGSLLSQQTLLEFKGHPPSRSAAPILPSCITDSRGGETRFAMSRQTQLQFNVRIPPNPSNVATNFKALPSPVFIETLPPMLHSAYTTKAFSAVSTERLALAVRLARRDLKHGLLYKNTHDGVHSQTSEHSTIPISAHANEQPLVSVDWTNNRPMASNRGQVSVEDHRRQHRVNVEDRSGQHRVNVEDRSGQHRVNVEDRSGQHRVNVEDRRGQHQVNVEDHSGQHRVNVEDRRGQRQVSVERDSEVTQLRRELRKQVQRLQELNERKELEKGQRSQDDSGEEREQRRAEEQAARNARMIYSLQQQVSSVEKDLQTTRTDSFKHTKKSKAVHKLAAAQRSAVRTLQQCSSHPLPSELTLLVQRLSVLSAQLQGGQQEMEEWTSLLQTKPPPLMNQRTLTTPQQSMYTPRRRTHRAVSKGKTPSKTSVLLEQQLHKWRKSHKRTSHFAQHTHSSVLKQRPRSRQPHPSPPSRQSPPSALKQQPCSRQPHPSPPSRQPHPSPPSRQSPPSVLKQQPCSRQPHPSPPSRQSPPSVLKQQPPSRQSPPTTRPMHKHIRGHLTTKELTRQVRFTEDKGGDIPSTKGVVDSTTDSQHMFRHVKVPSQDSTQSDPQLKGRSLQSHLCGLATETATRRAGDISDMLVDELLQDTVQECQRLEDCATIEQHLQSPDVKAMLARLEEIEVEEEGICQKWTSITYEDPLPMTMPLSEVRPMTATPLHLSPLTLSALNKHKEKYKHHLHTRFDPWTLVQEVAEEILEHLLTEVSTEMEHICDSCIDDLYTEEFARPGNV